jgi:hypothetical protein
MSATLSWQQMEVSPDMDFADYDPCSHILSGEIVGFQKVLVVRDFYTTGGAPPAELHCEQCGKYREQQEVENDAWWDEHLSCRDYDDDIDEDDDDPVDWDMVEAMNRPWERG